MGLVDKANHDGALLDGFLGVFDLEYAALGGAVSVSFVAGRSWLADIQGDGIVVIVISKHGD